MFVYSFTIEGYDVIVTIEFFPHVIVSEDFSPEPMDDDFEDIDAFLNCETTNGWKFILLCFILPLEYFTAENILLLGYFFIAVCFLLC